MEAVYQDDNIKLYQADALDLLRSLEAGSVDLVFADPPYFRVKDLPWDNQWKDAPAFLAWIGQLCDEFKRVLAPNGSLYLCACPAMAWGVEGEVRKRFNVLNSIRWYKRDGTFSRADVTTYRSWLSAWEAVIFAEQWGTDGDAMNQSGYEVECQRLVQQVFQIANLCIIHRVTRSQIGHLILEDYKNIESAKAQASNWILGKNIPSRSDFEKLKTIIPIIGEYEDLRQEYENLRREYETLRRPFNNSANLFRDDWHYAQIEADDTKHETEKPLQMLLDIVETSSRPGDLVVDPFLGRGSTAVACQILDRRFVGGDIQEHWVEATRARLAEARGEMHLRPRRPVKQPRAPEGQTTMWEMLE